MGQLEDFRGQLLAEDFDENVGFFARLFEKDDVFRVRKLTVNWGKEYNCALMFMDGMVNTEVLNLSVIQALLQSKETPSKGDITEHIKDKVLFANEVGSTLDISEMLSAIFYGDTVLIASGSRKGLVINTKGWRTRGISEPGDERVLQGPREGFDEALMMNLALIRRKLPTPDLKVELMKIGRKTDTKMFLCYLDSVVNKSTVREIKKRINTIDIDGVLDSNYINELIKGNRWSLFKTAGSTERPDIVAARLLEGRVALLVDGTPVALTMPYLFSENFQADDDYYVNFFVAGVGRILRYICFFLSISVPAVYLGLIIYHPYLLPTSFAVTVSAARGGIPFPSYIECFLLTVIFEILRETGIRMQQSVGHALSIVGGLVVGQAAVEAKIVSAPMLIVVALSGICGLMIPRLKGVMLYSRVGLIALATLFGLYGYFIGMVLLLYGIFSLDSFGVDYVGSLETLTSQSLKDTLIRAPWWKMLKRPKGITKNIYRQRRR